MKAWLCGVALLVAHLAFGATVIEDHFTEGRAVATETLGIEATTLPTAGPQRMLTILVDFPTRPNPLTAAQAADLMATVIRPYYDDVSYGRISMPVIDAVGPFAVPDGCDLPFQPAFDAADPTVDFRNYDYVSVWGDFNCGWGGIAFLGKVSVQTADQVVNIGTNNDVARGGIDVAGINLHELGHNFTVHHAGFLDCGASALTAGRTGCTAVEYGDPYAVMGDYRPRGDFEPSQRLQAGWLDPATELLTDPPDGRYTLTAHERFETGVVKALRLSRPNSDQLWISARSPLGFDANFATQLPGTDVYSGAILSVLDGGYAGKPLLLDAEAPRPDTIRAVLLPGMTFSDPDTGTSITTVSRSGDLLTVDVVHGPPPPSTTTTTVSPTSTTLNPRCHGNSHARWCRQPMTP